MKRLLSAFVFLFCTTMALPSYAVVVNRIVAVVNDDVITLHELEKESVPVTGRLQSMYEGSALKTQIYNAKRQVLEGLIDRMLAKKEIDRLGIKVSDEEVNAAIDRIKQDNSLTQDELIDHLKKENSSLDELKKQIRQEIERARLLDKEVRARIIITDEQMKKYYEDNKDEFVGKNRVRLLNILIPVPPDVSGDQKNEQRGLAERLLNDIRSGASFENTAKKYSKGPNADKGGDMGFIAWKDLAPFLKEAIGDVKENGVSDIIETPYGFQIIKVAEKETSGAKPYEEVRDQIQKRMYNEQLNKRYQGWVEELRKKAYVKIEF